MLQHIPYEEIARNCVYLACFTVGSTATFAWMWRENVSLHALSFACHSLQGMLFLITALLSTFEHACASTWFLVSCIMLGALLLASCFYAIVVGLYSRWANKKSGAPPAPSAPRPSRAIIGC